MTVDRDDRPSSQRYRRRLWWALTAAFITASVAAGVVAIGATHAAGPRPFAPQTTVHRRGLLRALQGRASRAPLSPPVPANKSVPATADVAQIEGSGSTLIIPALGVRAPLVPTGAMGAPGIAALRIPPDIHSVGWWDGKVHDGDRIVQEDAPAPGAPGVALLAGHVDSAAAGPGALFYLRELKVGDLIEISDSAGHVFIWAVDTEPEMTPKSSLPPALWVTTGPPKLALVTCGGSFDAATGHYVDNVIVWARQLR